MRRVFLAAGLAALALASAAPVAAQDPAKQPRRAPEARAKRQEARAKRLDKRFTFLDKDRNGAVSRAEWPRNPRAFDRLDVNKDGQLKPDELRQRLVRQRRRR